MDSIVKIKQVAYITAVVVDPTDRLLVLLSDLLDWPVQSVELQEQVGRFVLVSYQTDADPDIMLCVGSNRERHEFNGAMAAFQEARRGSPCYPRKWRYRAMQASSQVKRILLAWACPDERAFVEGWVNMVVATMSTVQDGA